MIYVKSTLVGLGAVFVIFGLVPLAILAIRFVILTAKYGYVGIGIDRPVWHLSALALFAALLVFGGGFYWEFRQLTK